MVPREDRMVALNTMVPEPMKDWLRARAAVNGEANVSFTLREILRDAMEQEEDEVFAIQEAMEREARGGEPDGDDR